MASSFYWSTEPANHCLSAVLSAWPPQRLTGKALSFRCLPAAIAVSPHCLSAALSLSFCCPLTVFLMSFHCPLTVFLAPFHCALTVFLLPFHCPLTATRSSKDLPSGSGPRAEPTPASASTCQARAHAHFSEHLPGRTGGGKTVPSPCVCSPLPSWAAEPCPHLASHQLQRATPLPVSG